MDFLGFVSCQVNPDVWRQAATKQNEDKYHEHILLYVDDLHYANTIWLGECVM